jgi:2',3'-cyclic-nucleotide 2'-phosphodiesterase (5'-nucleotidase family)
MEVKPMKRILVFILIVTLSLSSVIAVTQVLPNLVEQAIAKPAAVQKNSEIAKVTIDHLIVGKKPKVQPRVQRTIVEGKYVIATWQWGEAAGQSALTQQGKRWKVISAGGGAINLESLKQKGVPTQIAERLMQKEQTARKQ